MPKLIAALSALVVGYLDGAGLGAASYDFLLRVGPDKDAHIVLVAALATGPLGALMGYLLVAARARETAEADKN